MTELYITDEFISDVPAAKMFKALILDADTLLPKLFPQIIKSIDTIEGDGGPGTIKQMNILEGAEVKNMKHRIDVLDKEKMVYSYTLIEGGDLGDKFESVSFEIKFEAEKNGGSKGTNSSKFYPKPGTQINEEEVKASFAKASAIPKAVEAYLLANPDA